MPKRAAISSGLESSTGLGMGGGVVSARTSPKNPTWRTNELTIASPTRDVAAALFGKRRRRERELEKHREGAVLQEAPVARQERNAIGADARGVLFAAAQTKSPLVAPRASSSQPDWMARTGICDAKSPSGMTMLASAPSPRM